MSSKSRTLEHFAQTAGTGDVLCHPNGAHIYTADCDGHIRVFSHSPLIQHIGPHSKQLDQQQPRHHTAAITAIAFNSAGTRIASASADHTVKLHDTTASPTAAAVTIDRPEELYSSDKSTPLCVAWLPAGNDVAVGSDDGVVRVVSALAGTSRQYRAHQTAVCSVAVSSDGQCLASIDRHGTLVVWDVDSRAALLEEQAVPRHEMSTQLDKQPKVQLVTFAPATHLLATPARSGAIALRSADRKWKVEHELTERGHTETPAVLAWSTAGGYLLAVSRTRCVVWQVADGELGGSAVIAQLALGGEESVLSAVWSTRDNSVLMMRDDGWMKKWNDVVPAHLPQPFPDTPHTDADAEEAVDTAQLRPVGDMDDDDDDGEEVGGRPAGSADGKEEADGQHRRRLRRAGDAVVSGTADVAEVEFEDDDMDDFIVDDTDGLYKDTEDDYLSRKARASLTSSNHTQPPFQPASTPPDPTTRRRYLTYNLIGSVVSTPPSDHAPFHSIEIVFADSATHRTQRLKDHYGFSLSALGEHGCVMAKVWESSQRPSVVFYRELAAWTANSDWTVHLPSPETAVCVAVTNKHVAVATDRQWVRLLSFSGRQCAVVSMPGPIISMVGGRDQLCVVYAAGMPLPNNQLLHARVVDPQRSTVTMDVPLPLSPGATLAWLGYSDKGGLLSMDSSGVLRLLSMQWGGQWLAVLDFSKKQTKDVHWPVGLIDDKLMCAVLKAGSGQKVPSTLSRPVLTAVQVELPFVVTDSHHVEQPHARAELMLYEAQHASHLTSASAASSAQLQPFSFQPSVKEQASLDKLLLPVIQLAIKADQGSRALDLTSQLYLLRSMESALLLAQTNRKVHLASRISLLIGERRRQEDEEKERKRAAIQGATGAGRAISVTEYINKADKRVAEERKRRLEQQKQQDESSSSTTNHRAAASTAAADEQQSDAGDEGETELTYSKNGKKRVKLVEKAEVMADRADSARQEKDEKEEADRRRQDQERREREQMVVEDDGVTTEQSSAASGGVDFLTQFRKQKEKEKRDKEEAEEREKEKEKEKKKKAAKTAAAANKQAKPTKSTQEHKPDRAESEQENSNSGGSYVTDGGSEVVEKQKEREKSSESVKEADVGSDGAGFGGLRKSVNPFAKRIGA